MPLSKLTWRSRLDRYEPDPDFVDDEISLRVCQLASKASEGGTFGVGAVLIADGNVLVEGHNRVYIDGVRSDLHAEMIVLTEYESCLNRMPRPREVSLVTSLEPCMMCAGRIVMAEISEVVYIADDRHGGMASRMDGMPPRFTALMKKYGQRWRRAECSSELRSIAHDIWDTSSPLERERDLF